MMFNGAMKLPSARPDLNSFSISRGINNVRGLHYYDCEWYGLLFVL